MRRIVEYPIEYCNSCCPNFYHNYEDMENVWCIKLNKKIFNYGEIPGEFEDTIQDYVKREFPKDCPLEKDTQ